MIESMRAVLARDLRGLAEELAAYPDDGSVWGVREGITNSAGTLVLHVAGNIQHFIGAVLGKSGYERDRVAEFNVRDVPRAELERELAAALEAVETVLPSLTEAQLDEPFPVEIAGGRVRTSDFLAHLVAHLGYHLGQVDYHRRMITGGAPVPVVSPAELRSR